MLNKGVYTDKELNSLIGLELKSQMVSHDDVLRTNKLEKVMKMTISLNELDDSDNLENGRPRNALFTYYVTSPEYSMQFEPSTPQYKKLKDCTITSLTLKITDQAGNIITDWARNDCSSSYPVGPSTEWAPRGSGPGDPIIYYHNLKWSTEND